MFDSLVLIDDLNPLEIILNSLQGGFSAFLSETLYKPFERVTIAFTQITLFARRENISRREWSGVVLRNVMVLMQRFMNIEHRRWIFTVRASLVEILKAAPPVLSSKGGWQRQLTRAATMVLCVATFGVRLLPCRMSFVDLVGILLCVTTRVFAIPLWVSFFPAVRIGMRSVQIIVVPFASVGPVTYSADAAKIAAGTKTKIFSRGREFFTAFSAAFRGDIQRNLLQLLLALVGHRLGNLFVRRFITPSQAPHILPQEAILCQ